MALALGYALASSLWTFGFWVNFYWGNPEWLKTAIHRFSAEALLSLVIGSFLVLYLSKKSFHKLKNSFAAVTVLQGYVFLAVVEKAYMWPWGWVNFPQIWHLNGGLQGLFGNTSMTSCVSALGIPFILGAKIWKSIRILACLTAFAVAYAAQSTMGFLTLLIGISSFYFIKLNSKKKKLFVILACLSAGLALGNLFDYQFFQLQKIDRWKAWSAYLKWFTGIKVPYVQDVGVGNGSFWVLGPLLQRAVGLPTDQGFWTWLHNDWLQSLLEFGKIGFTIMVICYASLLIRSYRDSKHGTFASLVAFGFLCFGMYPTNLAFTALLGMILVRDACDRLDTNKVLQRDGLSRAESDESKPHYGIRLLSRLRKTADSDYKRNNWTALD